MINNIDGLFELLLQDRLTVSGKRKLQKYFEILERENQQLKEVLEEAINKIEDIRMEKWSIMGTDIMVILDILNKGRQLHG